MTDAPDHVIATLAKNTRERIVIAVRSFKKNTFIDLRVQFIDPQGEWRPTAKGIGIKPELLDDVIDALTEAREAARSQGLLPSG